MYQWIYTKTEKKRLTTNNIAGPCPLAAFIWGLVGFKVGAAILVGVTALVGAILVGTALVGVILVGALVAAVRIVVV